MKIEIYISYKISGALEGKRKYPLYALHIYINNKPSWTTYISPEDFRTLEAMGIKQR